MQIRVSTFLENVFYLYIAGTLQGLCLKDTCRQRR